MKSTEQKQDRRAFLKKSGKAALAAPAVALLVSANARKANAQEVPYGEPIADALN